MHPYLKRMGIELWLPRYSLSSCYIYELLRHEERVGLLFAEADQEDSVVTTLLNKMVQALQCDGRGKWYDKQPDCSALSGVRVVISLGEKLRLSQFAVPVIKSYSPGRLITTPHLKAKTWKTLQAVFPILSGTAYAN